MNKSLITFVVLLLAVSAVLADCSVSSLTTSAASAAQVGDSLVVTVTYSGSGCSGQQLYLDTAGGITADPTSKTLSSDSGSTTFSVSAAVPDTYSYNARLSSTSSATASVSFISPDVLTVSDSSNPSTVSGQAVNSAFTLSIILSNPSAADITTTYSFTYDGSHLSISGGATSGSVTIGAGETTTVTRSVTPITYFIDDDLVFNLGSNTGAFTTAVSTVSRPLPSSGGSSSSKKDYVANATANVTTNQTTSSDATNASTSTQTPSNDSSVVQPPPSVNETEKYEVSVLIEDLKSKLAIMKNSGYDVSSVESSLQDAIAAFDSGDYQKAKSIIIAAASASDTIKKLSTATPIVTPEKVVAPSEPPATSSLPLIFIIGGVILVGVVAVAAYLLLFNKQR